MYLRVNKVVVLFLISGIVEDVFSEGFVSVREDETLSTCLALFKKEKLPALAVFDNKGSFKGFLSLRWIIRSRLDPSKTTAKTMMRRAPVVTKRDSLIKAARLMIESDIRKLPVYSEEEFIGFVTEDDVIFGAVTEKWGNTIVDQIMTKNPLMIEESDSVGRALSLFRDQDISHAPIVKDGKLVGIISIRDIIEHVYQPKQRQTVGEVIGEKIGSLSAPVKGIMSRPVITVLPENNLRYAAEKMREFDISSLVIVRNNRPIGVVTKKDFLESIVQMEKKEVKFALQLSVKGIDLDEIQRSIIMNDFKSLLLRYEKALEAGTLFVYMKRHGTSFKGRQLIQCRLQLRTRKGSFYGVSEGWDITGIFRRALDRLDRQILRSKELERDQQFARRYLQRIQFP